MILLDSQGRVLRHHDFIELIYSGEYALILELAEPPGRNTLPVEVEIDNLHIEGLFESRPT